MFDLTLITVNYHGSQQTELMLETLKHSRQKIQVIIVDNSESEEEFARLTKLMERHHFLDQNVIKAPKNLGYMGGLNFGLKSALRKQNTWTILCNNDLLFDPTFILNLEKIVLELPQDVLCVAPKVKDSATDIDLNPFLEKRPTRQKIAMLRFQYSNFYIAALLNVMNSVRKFILRPRPRIENTQQSEKRPIYAGHGSIFILRSEFAAQGFDDCYFLYAEEVTIAEACLERSGVVLYAPSLMVSHVSHSSTSLLGSRNLFQQKAKAIDYVSTNYLFD